MKKQDQKQKKNPDARLIIKINKHSIELFKLFLGGHKFVKSHSQWNNNNKFNKVNKVKTNQFSNNCTNISKIKARSKFMSRVFTQRAKYNVINNVSTISLYCTILIVKAYTIFPKAQLRKVNLTER